LSTVSRGAALAAVAWGLPAPAAHLPPLSSALGIALRAELPADSVALTFDDGPHPQGTPAVLDALAAAGATATFFVVGEQARAHPSLLGEIVAAGHRLAVHGDRHRCQLLTSPAALRSDLERCEELVRAAQPGPVGCWRAPYGVFSPAGLLLGAARGWTPLLWSQWGRDWQRSATPQSIARRAGSRAVAGDVLLLHDADHYGAAGSWRRTAGALPILIDGLAARGLRAIAI
jgi:peptidoglycan/xylan/chitin deacetylase (PgdA/CDA1 family)